MVKINKIYTKTGDDGTTGLVGGERIAKDAGRVEAYGELDELNSFVGAARTTAEDAQMPEISALLAHIQNHLFDMGALLATPPGAAHASLPLFPETNVSFLEQSIDHQLEHLEELNSFVLPGGSQLNSMLHICRAVCRRVERRVISLGKSEDLDPTLSTYLNRLSDLFFAMARSAAKEEGKEEFLWVPNSPGK